MVNVKVEILKGELILLLIFDNYLYEYLLYNDGLKKSNIIFN
jgi:hypothetical protein